MLITITWLVVALAALVTYLHRLYTTFTRAGVNQLPPLPFFGHVIWTALGMENITDAYIKSVSAFPDDKIVGIYEMMTPLYVAKDIEIIKKITIKDFDHFVDRRLLANEKDPLLGGNLLNLRGNAWKEMRSTLSPTFTSSKIRMMVPFMVEVGKEMLKVLHQKIKDSDNGYIDLKLKDLSSRYANDVIASCAFGLKTNSQASDSPFFRTSKDLLSFDFLLTLKLFMLRASPLLFKILKINIAKPGTNSFFRDVVLSTMHDREKNNIIRHDMINILNELKKGTLSNENEADNEDAGLATAQESTIGKKKYKIEWTDDDLVAQAIIFLVAGSDTVSSAMTFILHEMAMNPHLQDRLAKEIRDHHAQNSGKFDFNSIQNMKYMDMVVSEGLRLYPPGAVFDRVCVKDYNFGRVNKTSNKDLIVRKGDIIGFPIWTFHRDPQLFPDPLKFDPERFSDENKHKIKPFSFMPFGLGPRNCIGSRFALCEVKVMLYQLLREMEVVPCEKTVSPPVLDGGFVVTINDNGAWARLKPRQ